MDKKIKSRLPPFTEALMNHTKEKQFPFDTPGHHGGAFYNLTEEGKAFTRFYGNAMFAADMSDSGNDPGNPSLQNERPRHPHRSAGRRTLRHDIGTGPNGAYSQSQGGGKTPRPNPTRTSCAITIRASRSIWGSGCGAFRCPWTTTATV